MNTLATIKRFAPITLIALLMLVIYFSGAAEWLSFETIKANRAILKETVAQTPILAPLTYIILYIVITALSIPGAALMTIGGGFLFGQPYALLYVVIGATLGAIALFLAARTALGNFLRRKAGPLLQKMEAGFRDNAVSYLLFLRLVPLFPFWAVNLAPAFFGVPLHTYAWTTFVGIIPGSFVYTQAGTGLGAIFDADKTFSLNAVFNRDIKIALAALGVFALLPILLKRWRKNSTTLH